MGERKVINHYISPDFDHTIIPKSKKNKDLKNSKTEVRTMIPFSMRCDTCNEYMYLGKKFNCKMERTDKFYMKTRILRFYIKCCVCSAEITYLTDPQNSGYILETGASRNFELWRDTETAVEEAKRAREEEDEEDAMKKLENRTMDNKAEMDTLDALDEVRAINQRHERVDTKALLAALSRGDAPAMSSAVEGEEEVGEDGLTASERALVKATFTNRGRKTLDSDDEDGPTGASSSSSSSSSSGGGGGGGGGEGILVKGLADRVAEQTGAKSSNETVTIVRKKRRVEAGSSNVNGATAAPPQPLPLPPPPAPPIGGLAGLAAYGSDSD